MISDIGRFFWSHGIDQNYQVYFDRWIRYEFDLIKLLKVNSSWFSHRLNAIKHMFHWQLWYFNKSLFSFFLTNDSVIQNGLMLFMSVSFVCSLALAYALISDSSEFDVNQFQLSSISNASHCSIHIIRVSKMVSLIFKTLGNT